MGIQLGGLASGMDTEQIVRDLMRAERVRVDKYYRREESIKWQQEALNTTNKTLAEFILKARSGFGLTSTSSNGTIINKSTDSFDWVKKVSSSDESVVKATASANAMEGTYKINVTQLASVASVTSKNISNLLENGKFTADAAGEFKLNVNIKEDDGTTKTATTTIQVTEGQTMNDLIKQINNAKVTIDGKEVSLGFRAGYDSSLGKLMISTKDQGNQEISITGESGNLATSLANKSETIYKNGSNAIIDFNGQEIKNVRSNNLSVFGINLQLQAPSASKEITINVESNVDGIMDKVKDFVKEYNTLIDSLNLKLKEKSYRDYQPLTKEEKEAMKENEIELWEEKAKSGLLRNDPSITRMLQSMRSGLYENVTNASGFSHITQIGITTGDYQSGGKLEIDEKKLRKAIVDNPDGVIDLLFKKSSTKVEEGKPETIKQNRDESGLVERIFNDMISGMKDIVRRSGTGEDASLYRSVQSNMLIDFVTNQSSISVLDKDLTSIGSRIAREERTLTSREQRYWSKFTAMEKALQSMNSQSSWLASQLGQM